MSTNEILNDPKSLLKAAEEKIVELQRQNQALQADLESVLQAQALETQQLVQLTEQMWKLEETLMNTTEEKDAALLMLRSLKSNVARIKAQAEQTLAAVKDKKASRLAMAVQVFEIKSMVETLGLDNTKTKG